MTLCQLQGRVQNQDGVVHLRAERIWPLSVSAAATIARSSLTREVFPVSHSPIRYAALLRRELRARNASYVALEHLPHGNQFATYSRGL